MCLGAHKICFCRGIRNIIFNYIYARPPFGSSARPILQDGRNQVGLGLIQGLCSPGNMGSHLVTNISLDMDQMNEFRQEMGHLHSTVNI